MARTAQTRLLKKPIFDKNGYAYKQEISVEQKVFDMLQDIIDTEINMGYPRKNEYSNSNTNYLERFDIVDNKVFLNLTTTRFLNIYLKLDLENENTYLTVRENTPLKLNIDEFTEQFEPINNPNRVWTLIDSDDGLVIVSGYHLVNRVHYIITTECWSVDTEVEYCEELVS